jgi:predicted kinase
MSQSQRFNSQHPHATGLSAKQHARAATLLLMVGLPGAGKTTRATELAATHRALRLTPDHWMIPLFGDSMADGKRWVLDGRLISVAVQALRLGTSVVLDFGLWSRDERSALRWLARSVGGALTPDSGHGLCGFGQRS